MVRISDARMSGTAYGTVVLHAAPEAAAGGPLALVQERRHHRARRRAAPPAPRGERRGARAPALPRGQPPAAPMQRGYTRLYFDHVQQADKGADLDFLVGSSGSAVGKDNH